ncbi:MAG: alpha-E domain-containing protein [Dehalococcoidia bacterium]
MLSRVAENLYWLGRYLERAENMARIAAVNYRASFEERAAGEDEAVQWDALVHAIGSQGAYEEAKARTPDLAAGDWLLFAYDNPGSLRSTIARARGLARELREHISREVFEEINQLYLASSDADPRRGLRPYTATVQRGVAATFGLYDNTVLYDEGREWFRCGMYIERADMTSRIIDAKYYMLLPSLADVDGPLDRYGWLAILRSASAHEAFRKRYRGSIRGQRVAELLILDPSFPRSLRFCVTALGRHFGLATSGAPRMHSLPVTRELAILDLDLGSTGISEIMRIGLHQFLGEFQARINHVHDSTMNDILRALPASMP